MDYGLKASADARLNTPAVKASTAHTHVLACPRIKAAKVWSLIPTKFIEDLEQNQKIASCCRHPENHDIEAFKSHPDEHAPDIYIFHCTCGRKHHRFMVGGTDLATGKGLRPHWSVA